MHAPRMQVELAPIQALLPDEVLLMIMARTGSFSLGSIACVCRHWRVMAEVRAHIVMGTHHQVLRQSSGKARARVTCMQI